MWLLDAVRPSAPILPAALLCGLAACQQPSGPSAGAPSPIVVHGSEHLAWDRSGIRVVLCPSREEDAWQGVRGRVQEVARLLGFGGSTPEETVAFVAGMTAMVDDVKRTLAAAGVPPARVHANF